MIPAMKRSGYKRLDPIELQSSELFQAVEAAEPLLSVTPQTPSKRDRPSGKGYLAFRPTWFRIICFVIGIAIIPGLYWIQHYSGPTTIPIFGGCAFMLVGWIWSIWFDIVQAWRRGDPYAYNHAGRLWITRIPFGLVSLLVLWLSILSLMPIPQYPVPVPPSGQRYFIGASLYNNEGILPDWTTELAKLIDYLGQDNVYVSIYQSNSQDSTPTMLRAFGNDLRNRGVRHRIESVADDGRNWRGLGSHDRIVYLAGVRNRVLEPIQSPDHRVCVPDYASFTKIVFLNDIIFRWQDIARLIDTRTDGEQPGDYDMACAIDHGGQGFYDTWVWRDICGDPARVTWPYVKDKQSQQAMRAEKPFPVATCWNGAVVLNAEPILYGYNRAGAEPVREATDLGIRDWRMIDNSSYADSKFSPPVSTPLRFRASDIEHCNHSECFLLPYDLHRLYRDVEGRPRILVNPTVRVAYEKRRYLWWNVVVRMPVLKWWRDIWSHGIVFYLTDHMTERKQRTRDQCTWAGLKIPSANGRCPPLAGRPDPEDKIFGIRY